MTDAPLEATPPPAAEVPAAGAVGVASRLPSWAPQVGRFLVVGGSAAALDAGVLWLMVHAAGATFYGGRAVSILIAMVFAWWLNRSVTFRTPTPPSWREFGAYVVNSLAGAAINYAISAGLVAIGTPPAVGFVAGTGIAAVFNFFRYRTILG